MWKESRKKVRKLRSHGGACSSPLVTRTVSVNWSLVAQTRPFDIVSKRNFFFHRDPRWPFESAIFPCHFDSPTAITPPTLPHHCKLWYYTATELPLNPPVRHLGIIRSETSIRLKLASHVVRAHFSPVLTFPCSRLESNRDQGSILVPGHTQQLVARRTCRETRFVVRGLRVVRWNTRNFSRNRRLFLSTKAKWRERWPKESFEKGIFHRWTVHNRHLASYRAARIL